MHLYKVIEDDEYVYLVLELCSGGTLKGILRSTLDALKRHSSSKRLPFRKIDSESNLKKLDNSKSTSNNTFEPVLPLDFIRAVLRQVCDGLSYLHRNGIVHRDLNINNLLLKKPVSLESKSSIIQLDIKIADFGLALDQNQNETRPFDKKKSLLGKAGSTICGTPGFISPEVWRQTTPVSPASDIFSLGSILYSLVTGNTSPKGDLNLNKFPAELADLISRLLDEKPDQRLALKDILRHPFTLGPITTKRLSQMTKRMDDMLFSICQDGFVTLRMDGTSTGGTNYMSTPAPSYCMKISPGNENISIQRKQKTTCHTIGTLPQREWKKYFCAYIFVDMVKGLTPKVTIRCKNNAMVSSIDGRGNRCIIQKGCLMENGSFEVTVRDDIRRVTNKVKVDEKLREENLVLYVQAKELYENALKIEETMDTLQSATGMDCFPLKVGKANTSPHSTGAFNTFNSPNRTEYSAASTATTTASNVLRSITLKDIGTAFDLSDGIEVKFLDGSYIICSKKTDHPDIVYSSSSLGTPCKFSLASPPKLPNDVRQKLSLVPMAIEKLRQAPLTPQSTTLSHLTSALH